MFILDIDGCITDGKGENIDLVSLNQLKQQIHKAEQGTMLCTGRSALYVEAIAQMLDLKTWCICENGAYIYHTETEEIIYNPDITPETKQHLKEIQEILTTSSEFTNISKLELGKEICISLNPIGVSIEYLYHLILDKIDLKGVHIAHSTTAVDITPLNINKENALLWLAEKFNIDLKNAVGVGDSMGDFGFISLCGYKACPNNASQQIKDIVDFVAESSSTKGLVEIYKYNTLNIWFLS
ncbi:MULTISPECIES: HAD family hydrolase [Pasteurellaceae]|uniref:HAD family hydrolase n=1 Tax=Pasteurella atlantica TaxID=2827233 RepID=A0AAW8CMI5_9PAST|nr:HAD family hydrolase [Pasteurella atlantica]MBR0572616.1 HAD family phosphatase [Pasteurella atlantica]MDP8038562.1 HAD family hydrolase [Pasteurella atlantica]MDP8040654.1 HAD family hydrolase [Pasteurella atlantica]MDP8042789.1 HAD family hydrolase [Pasteurella atlantica]MDP8044876.1 HAD family hydrolase [Pasteurella atlantica]